MSGWKCDRCGGQCYETELLDWECERRCWQWHDLSRAPWNVAAEKVAAEVSASGVRFVLRCEDATCGAKLELDLACVELDIAMEFFNSRAREHLKSLSFEFGWSEDEFCPGCARRRTQAAALRIYEQEKSG